MNIRITGSGSYIPDSIEKNERQYLALLEKLKKNLNQEKTQNRSLTLKNDDLLNNLKQKLMAEVLTDLGIKEILAQFNIDELNNGASTGGHWFNIWIRCTFNPFLWRHKQPFPIIDGNDSISCGPRKCNQHSTS